MSSEIKKYLIQVGTAAAALTAIIILWNQLEIPTVAWSGDIKYLKEENIRQGVDLYTSQLRMFLYHPPRQGSDPIVMEQWREVVKEKRRDLEIYEDRYIELEKEKAR